MGNKCDSPDKKVKTSEGEDLASQMGIPFFETSAKDNLNIETVSACISIRGLSESQWNACVT